MLVTPNFSDVQDKVEPGEYSVRVVSVDLGEWPAKADRGPIKHLQLRMETFGEDMEKNNGRSIFDRVALEGGGAFRLQDLASAVDMDVAQGFDTEDLIGKELRVVVTENNGYMNVKSFGKLA